MVFVDKLRSRARKSISVKAIDKFSPYYIILAPILTEKTYNNTSDDVGSKSGNKSDKGKALQKYFFKVHKDANKNDVKQAIQFLYNVSPKSINIINVKYKNRQQRGMVRKAYKKAIITLSSGEKIEVGS